MSRRASVCTRSTIRKFEQKKKLKEKTRANNKVCNC